MYLGVLFFWQLPSQEMHVYIWIFQRFTQPGIARTAGFLWQLPLNKCAFMCICKQVPQLGIARVPRFLLLFNEWLRLKRLCIMRYTVYPLSSYPLSICTYNCIFKQVSHPGISRVPGFLWIFFFFQSRVLNKEVHGLSFEQLACRNMQIYVRFWAPRLSWRGL